MVAILKPVPEISPETDGRTARAERTRRTIAAAMLSLIQEGALRPTAPRVAERAGVSLRSVFHHFKDMEALYAIAADVQAERLAELLRPIDASAPLADRLDQLVQVRSRLFEDITPVRRAVLVDEPFSPVIAARLRETRVRARDEISTVFGEELAARGPAERRELLAALTTVAEWTSWEGLRAHQGLSAAAARRVMRNMLMALLTYDAAAA